MEGILLSVCKRVVIDLPGDLAGELEKLAKTEQTSHEELLCRAAQAYVVYCKYRNVMGKLCEQMKKGYEEMGSINITLAEEGLYGGTSKK